MTSLILNLLTIVALLFGLFFMVIGAVGLVRLPDFYGRMHAGSKCLTLGISGMLLATVFHLADPDARPVVDADAAGATVTALPPRDGGQVVAAVTKAVLVIAFQFVAAPVGAHMLSRAAHADGVAKDRVDEDDLEADRPTFADAPAVPDAPARVL